MQTLRPRLVSRAALTLGACVTAVMLAGCGLGGGPSTKNATVSVTRDFGSDVLGVKTQKKVPGAETVMSLLERNFKVSTRYGGGFVESINGQSGTSSSHDWFFYVNGILAPKGAAATTVNAGDQVWWDLHDWRASNGVPAVVGSYPEPFLNGVGGKRFPTLLDCAPDAKKACRIVAKGLTAAGVKVSYQAIGGESEADTLAMMVGTWKDLHGIFAMELIDAGPAHSGVYAQFVGGNGQALELDNPAGQVVRTLRGNAGLLAATDQASQNDPTWVVTGTDTAGVDAAAAALTPATLRHHFAVALSDDRALPIPLDPKQ
jgi:hypothetical protein